MILLARILIRLAAALAPGRLRARWREEWLAELAEIARRGGSFRAVRFALGAPLDALSSRWTMRSPADHSGWRGPWQTDAKQTLRLFVKSPWHVAAVSLCLGIGIAVTVTVFSILNSILTGDLPGIADRARVVRLYMTTDGDSEPNTISHVSSADYAILREGTPVMPGIAAEAMWRFAMRPSSSEPTTEPGAFVSGNYFDVLGTVPAAGRFFTSRDDAPDAEPVAVLSHAYWKARLGAPGDIAGRTIVVAGRDVTVVGVAPEHFSGLDVGELGEPPGRRFNIYVPLAQAARWPGGPKPDDQWIAVVGRTAADLSRDALARNLKPLAARIEAAAAPGTRTNVAILSMSSGLGPGDTNATIALIITLLMSAPLTVLAIGCANVANLQLVRAGMRAREIAVRLSIGASRAQIVRLLTFEAALLAATACGAGALGTYVLLGVARQVVPFQISITWNVVIFTALVGIGIVLATGLLPAFAATRGQTALSLRAGRTASLGNSRLRRVLVMAQVTMCMLLLLTAAMFTRSIQAIAGRVPAQLEHLTVTDLRFDTLGYTEPQRRAFLDRLTSQLERDSRVRRLAFTDARPMRRFEGRFWLQADDIERRRFAGLAHVSASFFDVAGQHLIAGRGFSPGDEKTGGVAIVDAAFVERFGLGDHAIGQVLRVAPRDGDRANARREHVTIVGVAGNATQRPMIPEPQPTIYLPLTMLPDYVTVLALSEHPAALMADMRTLTASIDPNLAPVHMATMRAIYLEDAGPVRLLAKAAGGLGAAALLLAVAGIYSVMAFFVSLRTREFGIRLAIGARREDIVRMIVGQAGRLVLTGVAAGTAIGIPLLLLLRAAFPYISPFDPLVIGPTVGVLAGTALVAAWLPARRAAGIDAASALRAE